MLKFEWVRFLYSWFFFRQSRFSPILFLRLIDVENKIWESLGEDPAFLVKSNAFPVLAGWYMIELKISSDEWKSGKSKFYFSTNTEFNENNTVSLTFKAGRVVKRLCYFSENISHIRFDPMETSGVFQLQKLKFVAVSDNFALSRMHTRVNAKHGYLSRYDLPEMEDEIKKKALKSENNYLDELYSLYDATFNIYTHEPIFYQEWLQSNQAWRINENEVESNVAAFSLKPKISIILPTYNTDLKYLRACIDSVKKQYYKNWQLCIADDASSDSDLHTLLTDYCESDDRIQLVFRKDNGHISLASNSALELANGDFITFLDHDDLLDVYALYFIVDAVNKNPEAELIYTDEDKITEDGERVEPHFKSDFNPDLLLSHNYVTHLAVYKTSLMDKVGGCRKGVEGSQDYDLLLRCLPFVNVKNIIHVPHVLYHWRVLEGSTAREATDKSYTSNAGLKALHNFFQYSDPTVEVSQSVLANTYCVQYPIPESQPLVSLLIPTRDYVDVLSHCIDSILEKTDYLNYEIIILDNQSEKQETLDYFDRIVEENKNKVRVIAYDYSFNFSAINNFGVKHAKGSIVGLVNNDIEVISSNWMREMVSHCLRQDIGCVGAKLYYPDNSIQHAGIILGIGGVAGHSHKYFQAKEYGYFSRLMLVQNLSAVTAACLFVRKSIYMEVSGLNERDLTVAFNDVDFCLRVQKAGYRNLWTPYAELYHHESKSRGIEDTPDKQQRFRKEAEYMKEKWGELLLNDPYYNPNLTLEFEDFSLRV